MTRSTKNLVPLLLAAAAFSCSGDTGAPDLALRPVEAAGPSLSAEVDVSNLGDRAIGPIDLAADEVRFEGSRVPGLFAAVLPSEIPTLEADRTRRVRVELDPANLAAPGVYQVRLVASTSGGSVAATLPLELGPRGVIAATLSLDAPSSVRQGDVVALGVQALDDAGQALEGVELAWRVEPTDAGVVVDRRFVAYATGPVEVVATSGAAADSATLDVTPRDATPVTFAEVGGGAVTERYTSDLWVSGDHAYTGTWGSRVTDGVRRSGNTLDVWDTRDPRAPALVDQVTVDARTVNDVKVSDDGTLAVISHELSNDGLNGITLLDLADPAHPIEIARYTAGLSSGVHNLWIDGGYLYVVLDGVGRGLRILDIGDPAQPELVAAYYAGESFLHDVLVRDGLAFLSHWDAGLVILDVGNGIAGGSPTAPVEVSRIRTAGGQTHNAWYWPEAGYVFVGEEDFGTPGRLHVVDVSDLWHPREVASYAVPGATPHNIWVDEERGILYAAWYERGLRAVDVSGELLGALDLQGRELGASTYAGLGLGQCTQSLVTCTWAPQLHEGRVYVSDMNTGLHVLRPDRP